MDDELKELRKVRFVQPFSGKTVRFLEGGQVLGKLKASTEVIIVSPFCHMDSLNVLISTLMKKTNRSQEILGMIWER